MKDNGLISIIMPCYNVEEYINITILSIISQTFENWELIVIDDNSTDKTANIVKNFSMKDKRIRYYKNEINLGFTKNVNKAFPLAKGEYCVKFDADDLMRFDFLEKLLNCLIEDKTIGHVTAANNPTIDENGNEILNACPFWINEFSKYFDIDFKSSNLIKFPTSYIPRFYLTNYALGGLTGTLFKLSDAKKIGYFDEHYKWASDFDFTLKLCSICKYKAFLMEPIWSFRQLPFSNTSRFRKEGIGHLEQNYLINRVFELFSNYLEEKELDAGIDKWLNHAIRYNLKYAKKGKLLNLPPFFDKKSFSVKFKVMNLLNEAITIIRKI